MEWLLGLLSEMQKDSPLMVLLFTAISVRHSRICIKTGVAEKCEFRVPVLAKILQSYQILSYMMKCKQITIKRLSVLKVPRKNRLFVLDLAIKYFGLFSYSLPYSIVYIGILSLTFCL